MSRQTLSLAIHTALLCALAACSAEAPPAAPPAVVATAPAPAPVAATPPPVAPTCAANMAWITNPTEPSEVASSETFCDFYQFSWQWFLAQVSPADPNAPTGDRVFETANRVVDPQGGGNQCSANALSGKSVASKMLAMRVPKPLDAVDSDDFEDNQADGNPLYDQAGNVLYFNMWYSPEECQATSTGFAPGTLEIKTAWRVLPGADPSYYTMQATLPSGGSPVTLGLVGFHLVNWTSAHPEMIWASFEHRSNAPLCDGTSAASGWSLASDAAAACLAANPSPSGSISPNCTSHDFNTPPDVPTPTPPTGTPDEVCRLFENGNQPGTSINGNDNAANLAAIQQLNEALVGPNGMLTGLPADNPMAVWKNYEMVGALWTKNGAASGNPPVPNAGGAGDPNSPQRGSLELTNMTMETYQQGATSPIPNCFGCHNYDPSAPLKVSHIADHFLLPPSVAEKPAPSAQ